jgi:hypothetical protein
MSRLFKLVFLDMFLRSQPQEGGGRAVVDRYGNAKLEGLRTFFPFKNGIPSHDSLGRVFGGLDTVESYAAMQKLD